MQDPAVEKIECPSCGQHYSIEVKDRQQDVTCQVCNAVFTVDKIADDPPKPETPSPKVTFKVAPRGTGSSSPPGSAAPSGMKANARPSILDRFMGCLFRFGKTFAGILALLCLLAIIASSGVFVWNLHTGLDVPTYADIAPSTATYDSPDTGELDTRRAIEKQYGDRVAAIVKDYKFEEDDYYAILSVLSDVDPDNWNAFLKGLEKTLKSRAKAAKDDPEGTPEVKRTTGLYMTAFSSAESRYESDRQKAKTTRLFALGAVFVSCFMLFMMLVIPALLRIEENTRRG